MLNKYPSLKLSPYIGLYDIVVKPDNKLRVFHDNVDFSFVRDELKDRYSENLGKDAVDPVMLIKALVLKELTDLSDADLVEEIRVNLAYKYFLDMLPEEQPFDSSLLSYFRRRRLKGDNLLSLLLSRSLELAIEHGALKAGPSGKVCLTVAVDSTHTESLGRVLNAKDGITYFSNKLCKAIRECFGLDGRQWGRAPKFADMSEALAYGKALLERAAALFPDGVVPGKAGRCYNRLAEALEDLADHGSCSPSDRDARHGHKSTTATFDGYKTHLAVDTETGIILEGAVTSGEASDTTVGERIADKLTDNGRIGLKALIGDGAYGSTEMMRKADSAGFELVATPNAMLGSGENNYLAKGFSYNKDADRLVCPAGHLATRCVHRHYKLRGKDDKRPVRMFYFDVEKCKACSKREGCYKEGAKTKSCSVTILDELQKKYLEKTNTDEFKKQFKKRTAVERTNSGLKSGRSPGMRKAMYYGIEMMTVQAAVAIFTFNLKVIFKKKVRK